ncbi:hypothetical protein [Burkholderia gladioli]|uniref:hypothetical protein n=1 Tax=Burkholderia gladioli TaxID=28095 RepID=UPI001640C6E2|nr:hypothetical protein [Burkholderia gladioli]
MSHPYTDAQVAALARFAGLVFAAHRNDGYPGDVDGADLQTWAEECGLIESREMFGPCGEQCSCADSARSDDWPIECYISTELGRSIKDAARDGGGS